MALFVLSVAGTGAGCKSVLGIRPPVPTILQGNVYAAADLAKLSSGMTDRQVLYVLGTPLLRPIYAPNEWYYYSAAIRENQTNLRRLLVLRFEGDKLIDWEERFQQPANARKALRDAAEQQPSAPPTNGEAAQQPPNASEENSPLAPLLFNGSPNGLPNGMPNNMYSPPGSPNGS